MRPILVGILIAVLSFIAIQQYSITPPATNFSQINHCDDPFADRTDLKFKPELWTAKRLARYVDSTVLDPNSGLQTNFCQYNIDYAEIISGGPPPDGIPPIDNPTFESIAKANKWLADGQPVLALAVDKAAKAYPLAILTRHEIANDTINGIPIAVTFCPLCNTAIVFKRTVKDKVLRFGVSGNLRNSDMIMWDNQTLSWWQQFTGEAIVGDLTGTYLELMPSQLAAWQDFKTAYPDGLVLSRSSLRSYGINPYAHYDSSEHPFLYLGNLDRRLPAMARVLGYFSSHTTIAYPLTVIAKQGLIEDILDGQPVAIFYAPGQLSALDKPMIADSKAVGSATLFSANVKGRQLTFKYQNGVRSDIQTGSQWNVFGQAIKGELKGTQLVPILRSHVNFWFAWAAFKPKTEIYSQQLVPTYELILR